MFHIRHSDQVLRLQLKVSTVLPTSPYFPHPYISLLIKLKAILSTLPFIIPKLLLFIFKFLKAISTP